MAVGRFCVGFWGFVSLHNECFRDLCKNNIQVTLFQAEELFSYVRVLLPLIVGIFSRKMIRVFEILELDNTYSVMHLRLAYILLTNVQFVMLLCYVVWYE